MFTEDQIAEVNKWSSLSMAGKLGIQFIPSEPGTFAASMPVDERTTQPLGLLHGGATAVLAETLGSTGSVLLIDRAEKAVVGIEVSANHLKGVRSGTVTATGRILHQGRTTHVWDIRVSNDEGQLVAVCRMTNLIIDKR